MYPNRARVGGREDVRTGPDSEKTIFQLGQSHLPTARGMQRGYPLSGKSNRRSIGSIFTTRAAATWASRRRYPRTWRPTWQWYRDGRERGGVLLE